jgi:hypothetical protein
MGSPHKKEKVIGGNVDLDLLSFPSRRCKNHGRNGEEGKAIQSKQWRKGYPIRGWPKEE